VVRILQENICILIILSVVFLRQSSQILTTTSTYRVLPRHIPILTERFLCHPNYLFPPGVKTKLVYAFLISTMRATCLSHLILLDLITLIQVALVISGGCFPPNHRVYKQRVKREMCKMPVDFLSDAP
jgi:hypothetical protein